MAHPRADTSSKVILSGSDLHRVVDRIAHQILEKTSGATGTVLLGIPTRGVPLAQRLAARIHAFEGIDVPVGSLDITLYRDDLQTVGPRPVVGPTDLPWAIDGKHVVIVDDVLYTGRTVRAALDELADFGRPRRIGLAVLMDRGGRELPIQPDVVGKTVKIARGERIDVLIRELDERDAVIIATAGSA